MEDLDKNINPDKNSDRNINPDFLPVCNFLAVSMIVIFCMYFTELIKKVPSNDKIIPNFFSNFVHTEFDHLLGNIFVLYAFSRVEKQLGMKKFISLLVFLLIFNTVVDTFLHNLFPTMPCSIGFSGILFGIISWEITTNQKVNVYIIAPILFSVVLPSIRNTKISLSGHLIGAFSGIIGGILWKYMKL
jgi:membrane associated rhomboid family serine protease